MPVEAGNVLYLDMLMDWRPRIMCHPEGARETSDVRVGFDRCVRLEFHGSKISSDGGLLLFRELDEVLGLHDIASG